MSSDQQKSGSPPSGDAQTTSYDDPPANAPVPDTGSTHETLVAAVGAGLRSSRGWVFQNLCFDAASESVTALVAPDGSGKSAALLALTGRMSITHGSLTVDGFDQAADARRIRSVTSVARIAELVDLEERHTVAEAVVERSLVDGIRPASGRHRFAELAAATGIDFAVDALVEDLPRWHQGVLALLLAALRPARVIVIDDTDRGVSADQERLIYQAADTVSKTGCAVIASTSRTEGVPENVTVIPLVDQYTDGGLQ